jgi:signal transduction histidine kinase
MTVTAQRAAARPRSEGMPRVATAIAVSSWGLALLALTCLIAAVAGGAPGGEGLWFFAVDTTEAVVYGTVAAVVLARRRHVVPWLLALMALGCGLAAFGYGYEVLVRSGSGTPAAGIGALQSTAWIPGSLAVFLVAPWLIRERGPSGPGRVVAGLGVLVTAVLFLVQVTGGGGIGDQAQAALAAAIMVLGLVTAAGVAHRWRSGPVEERRGLGWLALGTAAMALSYLPLAIPYGSVPIPVWFTPSIHLVVQTVYPAAVLVVVLRQRLWGLDLVISRATLAGLLTAAVVVVYTAVTALAGRLVPDRGSAQAIAAVAVVLAVQPSRSWLQRRVQHLVYGPDEPARAVRRLGRQLGRASSPQELLEGLVETVGTAMRLESAVLRSTGGTARWGTPTSTPLELDLDAYGAGGCVLAVTTPPGEALDARGRRTLEELAGVVAAGVVLARSTQDLARARERLTSIRMEERRLIRREIHDGLGPSLAGIRLGLAGARNVLEKDPGAAADLLTALQEELDQRVADVRSISHSLLPPALDELGLAPALAELAARHAATGLDVRVECGATDSLPPATAGAAYGIVVEALTNVARHSGARTARITVTLTPEDLTLVVQDDGRGIPADAVPGVGTSSMRERAQEQGGELVTTGLEPTGTQVFSRLPLARRAEVAP